MKETFQTNPRATAAETCVYGVALFSVFIDSFTLPDFLDGILFNITHFFIKFMI